MSARTTIQPRKRLLLRLSQAVETLSFRKEPNTHVVPLKGVLDGKVNIQFFDVTSHEFDHFENISNALARLDRGTYGRCVFCGGRIEADVLAQIPWANECLACGDQEAQP